VLCIKPPQAQEEKATAVPATSVTTAPTTRTTTTTAATITATTKSHGDIHTNYFLSLISLGEFLHDFAYDLLVVFLVSVWILALACVFLCCFYWFRIRGKPNNSDAMELRERLGALSPVPELNTEL